MKLELPFQRKRHLPIVLQNEMAECGHACAVMIGHFYGHSLDLHGVRRLQETEKEGITLFHLSKLFETLGFNAHALRLTFEVLSHISLPAVLHWKGNHFVVLKSIHKQHVILHDPALGIMKYSYEEFLEGFTGVVLTVEPKLDFKPLKTREKLKWWDLILCIKGHRRFFIYLFILSFCMEGLSLIQPQFLQFATDHLINTASTVSSLIFPLMAFGALAGLLILVESFRGHLVIYFTSHITEQFSSYLTEHLLKLPMDFFEKRHKGDLQSKCQSIHQIQKKIGSDFINALIDGLMMTFHLLIMLVYSLPLTFFVCLTLSINLLIRQLFFTPQKIALEASLRHQATASSIFLENLQHLLSIKAFSREKNGFLTWRNAFIKGLNADITLSKWHVYQDALWHFMTLVERLVIVSGGVFLIFHHRFSFGMLLAFLAYRELFVGKASLFIQNIFEYRLISVYLERLKDILEGVPEKKLPKKTPRTEVEGSISVENLGFRYHAHHDFLFKNLSFKIPAKKRVAIIGPSGSGKSTLMKILMGLLIPEEGEIFIDDVPKALWGTDYYRNQFASVMQDLSIMKGSILDNITFFDNEVDEERAIHAAKRAHIHDMIKKLPLGYDTLLGEMNQFLSGGEKQRLLLARALYQRPKILFLDEATSQLDLSHEKAINLMLQEESITQIIIAHRKETIQSADFVIDLSFSGRKATPHFPMRKQTLENEKSPRLDTKEIVSAEKQ